jgi:hypothetical protein
MIKLELLTIAWAAKKTAMFIEAMPHSQLEIWTDHKPLVPILERYSLPEIENKRLQRLKKKIMHLQYTVKWVKGTENIEADCPSPAPHAKPKFSDQLDEDKEEDIHIPQIQVNKVCSSELRDECEARIHCPCQFGLLRVSRQEGRLARISSKVFPISRRLVLLC